MRAEAGATDRPAGRLDVGDATVVGLAAMLGAGVFVAFSPAAAAAGSAMVLALALAAGVAWCNARSTAQLAVALPVAGGAYAYGRAHLGPWVGFLAGWGFVVGKTASCAAMALAFAAYAAPAGGRRAVAVAAVLALTAIDLRGIRSTARTARVLVLVVLVVLLGVLLAGVAALAGVGDGVASGLRGGTANGGGAAAIGAGAVDGPSVASGGLAGVPQAAGLLFFAFAGYARIATLSEQVHDPARTIPRAIGRAFLVATALYAALALVALLVLGAERLAAADAPLRDVVAVAAPGLAPLVVVGAAAGALGALLALVAGIGRTGQAMAREGDLPRPLARVDDRTGVPRRMELVVAVAACGLVLAGDLTLAIGASSFGVLLYYLVANLAALRQPAGERLVRPVVSVLGAVGCAALVVALPGASVLLGVAVLASGVVLRIALGARRPPRSAA